MLYVYVCIQIQTYEEFYLKFVFVRRGQSTSAIEIKNIVKVVYNDGGKYRV